MSDQATRKQVLMLTALAQATRLQILARVAEAGDRGAPAGEIARSVRCPASTLSFHLKELSRNGILEGEPRGRFVIYRLRREALRELSRFIGELAGEPEARKPRRGGRSRARAQAAAPDRDQLTIFGD